MGELIPAADGGRRDGDTTPFPALAISLVMAGRDLGAASWKPKYRVQPSPGEEAVPFLPGHLGVAWPSCLRMGLLYRLFFLAYQERNRDFVLVTGLESHRNVQTVQGA